MKLLIDSCEVVVTMDDAGTELHGGSILIEDGVVTWVGTGVPPDGADATRLDGRGAIALPGLVNTHHHLCQVLTRVRAQDEDLFGWLKALYPVWATLDVEWQRAAAAAGLAELVLSGCTLSTDHHYAFPDGVDGLLEAEIEAARRIGVRFHPNRGSMDLGARDGGLPPQVLCQDADTILAETEAAVARFHDPRPGSMLQISVGPCYPLTNTPRLMRESAELARRLGVRLHTHIAEGRDEERFMVEQFGHRPLDLLDSFGFVGEDVWLAHGVQFAERDLGKLARTATSVATCPSSNLRLGSGIAPVRAMLDAGVGVGLGVDGSASNDSGNMLGEARQLLLVQRQADIARSLTAREVLRVATRGGAACLGRDDLGSIEVGKRGDVALFSIDVLEMVGAESDLVAGLVFCGPRRVRDVVIEGRRVVADGELVTADEAEIVAEARRVGRRIARTAETIGA
ncbi:MAG: 8-oxoguanine deaminase [Solirubrobacteraceae bacterium]|nr:8-oxoguanine deaminase [Solirubrobacteraceae bacterium]